MQASYTISVTNDDGRKIPIGKNTCAGAKTIPELLRDVCILIEQDLDSMTSPLPRDRVSDIAIMINA